MRVETQTVDPVSHRVFDLAEIRGGPNPGFGPAMDLSHLGLIEVRGLANKGEGLGWLASPIEVRGWGAGLAWALSIRVRA